jgi:serine/threonine protein kinase
VLEGLQNLHEKNCVHGDIRPANVMFPEDPMQPKEFFLIDFGSLNDVTPIAAPGGGDMNTMLGPSVRPERQSPFYSEERRVATEYESADTAFVIQNVEVKGKQGTIIRLGWRKKFKGKLPESGIKKGLEDGMSRKSVSMDDLVEKDLVRIREFVFKVIASNRQNGFLDLFVESQFHKVVHDRISIDALDSELPDRQMLSVPRVVEMKQLSAATDMFGFGSLILYTMFFGSNESAVESLEKSRDANSKDVTPIASENRNAYSLKLEKEFREVISTLENSTFFIQLWPQIEEVRYQLEKYFDNNGTNPDVEYVSKSFTDDTGTRGQSVQLKREVFRLVNSIGFSVPGVRRLLGVFNNNAAHFVFYFHFILCCIHRQDDIVNFDNEFEGSSNAKKLFESDGAVIPFCKNRLTKVSDGVANDALARLAKIEDIYNQKQSLTDFVIENVEFPEDLQKIKPPADLLAQNSALEAEISKLISEKSELESRAASLTSSNNSLKKKVQTVRSRLDQSSKAWVKNPFISKQEVKELLRE